MLSLAASRQSSPALLAHVRCSTASARLARPAAAVATAPRSIIIARRPLATAAMKSSDAECSASSSSSFSSPAESFVFKASLAALAAAPPGNLLFALASHADEAAAVDAAAGGGLKVSPLEIAVVTAPIAFYALLTAYRSLVNPKATIGDGLFVVAALVIVANIVSILAFGKRIY